MMHLRRKVQQGLGQRHPPWRNVQGHAARYQQHLSCRCHAGHGSGQTCYSAHACTQPQPVSGVLLLAEQVYSPFRRGGIGNI